MNRIREGDVTFDAQGAFYNPRMKLGRDICVAMVKGLRISDYLDALAASGIRGLRVAKEAVPENVTLNDISPAAFSRIEENIRNNRLNNCQACCSNANVLMHQHRFQTVDLDPFGTPSPFLSAAARSAESYLFITATDTAPLCGAHLKSGIRKYLAVPIKTHYHREMGARILLGLAARELARLDKAMHPLLTHVTEHYVRVYLQVVDGAKMADQALERMGYLEHCGECRSWKTFPELDFHGRCALCDSPTKMAGPLWLGPLHHEEVVRAAMGNLHESNVLALRLLKSCLEEIDIPLYYDHHDMCKRLGLAPSKIERVIADLRDRGWRASRTHFSGIGIKTDASVRDLEDILRHR